LAKLSLIGRASRRPKFYAKVSPGDGCGDVAKCRDPDRAIVFAIEQSANVDVGEIIVRPTAQS
jgi:NADP-dependent 3-hydroxy acid dehydrogenase YdfG